MLVPREWARDWRSQALALFIVMGTRPAHRYHADEGRPHAVPRTDRPIVLIVTTDERVLQAANTLPPDRFVVGYARSSQEALATARQGFPEVAVLELRSGDFGGFALAKELRDIPGMPAFRLVMLCDRPHDRWLCRQAGAEAVLVKPLSDPSALLEALDSVLQPIG